MRLAKVLTFVLALGLTALAQPAAAGQIFFDDFNSESIGLNYSGFANWNVSDGTVDLIGVGSQWSWFPAYGRYVDMDGSTGNAGKLTSKTAFDFVSGDVYTLSFDLAGNQRGLAGDSVTVLVNVSLGNLLSETISLPWNAGFTHYSFSFYGNTALSPGRLSFEAVGGDNVGMLLDNVSLSVPDGGATLTLLGCALIGLGAVRRRFRG